MMVVVHRFLPSQSCVVQLSEGQCRLLGCTTQLLHPDVNVAPSLRHRLHELLMDLVRVAGLLHPDQAMPGLALPLSHVFALHELDNDAALSQRDLAERLRLEKSTVSRLVADLESQGLLTRERDPDNRRIYRLRITDAGRQAHAHMRSAFHDKYVRMTTALTGREQAALFSWPARP